MGLRVEGGKAFFLQNTSLENLPVFPRNVKATQALTQFIAFMKLTLGPAPWTSKEELNVPFLPGIELTSLDMPILENTFYQAKEL